MVPRLVLTAAGNHEVATRLLSKSVSLYEELGTHQTWVSDRDQETLANVKSQLA
jgi:hypothetical protein